MRRLVVVAIAAAAMAATAASRAQSIEGLEAPVLLSADEIQYDQQSGVITAAGNVELIQGGRILRAQTITYNERTDTVTAEGEVVIIEPSGEVFFADYVELQDQLKSGLVKGMRMLFTDDTRLAANGARRTEGDRTELAKAVFSPCESCPEDPERPPLWQIKAVRVVHKQKAKRVEYYDAWLEFLGVPVLYTPYFTHPDPSVKRKTGLLAPRYGSSSLLGLKLETPYYFNVAPNKDATVSPLFTSKEGVVLGAQYRHRLRRGRFQFDGTVTRPRARDDRGERLPGHEIRGHVFGVGRFDINDRWRWGFDVQRSSDDTYLKRYDIDRADTLTSDIFIEGLRGRGYAAVNAFAFQGLREEDDLGETPFIWPLAELSLISEPRWLGGRLSADINLLQLTRTEGTDSRRLSLSSGWRLPFTSPLGDVYTISLTVRGDGYLIDEHLRDAAGSESFSGLTGRVHPRAALDWRFPFIRGQGSTHQIIEPTLSLVISPYGGNPSEIPNEDSISFEFDDTNLFRHDRFPGLDRVEGGPRLNLGIKAGIYGAGGASGTILFGQTFRPKADDSFLGRTGLERARSDYVGRLTISLPPYLDVLHRFRLNRSNLGFRRNEIDVALGPEAYRLNLGFVSLSRELSEAEAESRKELRASARLRLSKAWSTRASWRRDLESNGGNISAGIGVIYEDECLRFTADLRRDFTRDREVRPSTTLNFGLSLKHLG